MDIMIDIETLSTRPDAVIASVGACRFDPETGEIDPNTFHHRCGMDDQIRAGRHISASTLRFWLDQSPEAQMELRGGDSLSHTLDRLALWVTKGYQGGVWSNGASFDIPILEHAYATMGSMDTPWSFRSARCYRTLKDLVGDRTVQTFINPMAHNALADAIHQAKQASAYLRALS